MRTTLSVILPVRNGERHLGACLDSISLQKNDSMEILVLDDGSTDTTAALAEEKAKNDPRIRLIRKPNSGYRDTMNRGLELAKGKYVAFAESDDELLPDAYTRALELAEQGNYEMVKSDFLCFDAKGAYPVRSARFADLYNRDLESGDAFRLLASVPEIGHWSGIYRKEFLDGNGIRFNSTPGASFQDLGFYLKVLLCLKRFVLTGKLTYRYRIDNPASSMKSTGKLHCMEYEMDSVERFADERGILTQELKTALLANRLYHSFVHYRRLSPQLKREYAKEIVRLIRRIGWKNYAKLHPFDKIRAPLFLYFPPGFALLSGLRNRLLPG